MQTKKNRSGLREAGAVKSNRYRIVLGNNRREERASVLLATRFGVI